MKRKLETRLARLEERQRWAMDPMGMSDRELARRTLTALGGANEMGEPELAALAQRVMELLNYDGPRS